MWFKKTLALLLACLLTLTVPMAALAQESDTTTDSRPVLVLPDPPKPQPGEPDVGKAISPLRWGQTAPFTGVLLSPEAVATVIAEINGISAAIKVEVDRERKVQRAQCEAEKEYVRITLDADKKILQAQLDARGKEIKLLNDRLAKVEDSDPDMLLWVGGSFLAGVIMTVGVTLGVSYAIGAGKAAGN